MPTILIDSCPRNQQLRLPSDIGFSVAESTIFTTSMYRKAPPNSEVERSRKHTIDKVQMRPLHDSLLVRKQNEQLTSNTPIIRKDNDNTKDRLKSHDFNNMNPNNKKRSSSKNRMKEPLHYVDYIEDCNDMQSSFEKQNFNPRARFNKGELQKSLEIVMNSKTGQGKDQIVMKRNGAGSGSATPFSSSMRRASFSHFPSGMSNATSMPIGTQAERRNRRMYNRAIEGEIARNFKASATDHHDNDKSMDFSELYNHDMKRDLQSSTESSFSASGQSSLSDSEKKTKPILRKSSLALQESNVDLKCRQQYATNPLSTRTGERPSKHEQMVRKPCVSFSPYTTVFHGERRVNPEKTTSSKCEKNLTNSKGVVNVKPRGGNGMSKNTNTSTGKEEIEAPKTADEDMRQIKKISQTLMTEIHQKLLRRNVFSRKTNSLPSVEVQGPTPGEIHNQMRLAAANAAFEAISRSNKM